MARRLKHQPSTKRGGKKSDTTTSGKKKKKDQEPVFHIAVEGERIRFFDPTVGLKQRLRRKTKVP